MLRHDQALACHRRDRGPRPDAPDDKHIRRSDVRAWRPLAGETLSSPAIQRRRNVGGRDLRERLKATSEGCTKRLTPLASHSQAPLQELRTQPLSP